MKVTLTLELDIPDIEGYSDEELAQLIFDDYTNFNTCKHMEAAIDWCIRSEKAPQDVSAKMIYEHHKLWSEICRKVKGKITVA